MTAPLPYSRLVSVATGQPPSAGQPRTAGQPDSGALGHTAAGTPVWVQNYQPWASLYLVTVTYAGERRYTWVYGDPARLVSFAMEIGIGVEVERKHELDELLPPVVRVS
jgi:hypothetical protein